jgi:ZIP family zinc transporter
MNDMLYIAGGLGFIFLMTCAGGAVVFFFKGEPGKRTQSLFMGFAAGIMIAASIWSLLIPSIEQSEAAGVPPLLPAVGGFICGVLFLIALDRLIPHFHPQSNTYEGLGHSHGKRTTLMVLALGLHNIPEGMAVGLTFAVALLSPGEPALLSAAIMLALGIGIQNFPEGAAVSLPLRQEGLTRTRSFLAACATGVVEPLFGLVAVLLAAQVAPIMPWLLAAAAGAMLYVVVEELVPEAHPSEHGNWGTMGAMAGFLLMMSLDVALG